LPASPASRLGGIAAMSALDVTYVNPFIRAVDGLMSTMVKVPATLRKPRLRERGEELGTVLPIAVQVELTGTTEGVVAVAFTKAVATALASSLAGIEMKIIDADCRDALGEIGNLIVGQAKTELPGGATRMSVPKVLSPDGLEFPQRAPVLLVPFDTAVGPFLIAVACLSSGQEAPAMTAAA